jgi:hypothetical protein
MELSMGDNRNPALGTQTTWSVRRSPGYVGEIQASIGRGLAAEYAVPRSLPEHLATLVEQLAEANGEES